jgi:hypothetical protein
MKPRTILNSKGEPIVLNTMEKRVAQNIQRQVNALGYKVDITTLTTILARVTEQKFFQVAPADYLPVRVGEGAWSQELLTYRSFDVGDDFSTGVVNTGAQNSRLAQVSTGVDSISVKVKNWAKMIGWTLMDLEQASKSGNWDLVTALASSRKRNWDLGIQKVAFLGLKGDSQVKGLLDQSGIETNTTRITKKISTMSESELKTFVAGLIEDYRDNAARTAWPTHFIIPESDYLGLASQASATYPIKSVLQLLLEAFRTICMNESFQILPLAYADTANSDGVLSTERYTLLNYDEKSIRMDIPVDYNTTIANSTDNFSFQNVGYGQFTGAMAYRPKEMIYFDLTSG